MEEYPIHDTTSGEVWPGKTTYNPIPEGTTFTTVYNGMLIKLQVELNFSTDKQFFITKVVDVKIRK